MAATNIGARIVIAVGILSLAATLCHGFPATLTLERSFPVRRGAELTRAIERDRARHRRMLASSTSAIVDFPVDGTYDPFLVGLYYTKVQLGNPSVDFYVQIDTGSDALWVSCSSCSGCPAKTDLQIPLNSFNPASSSTSSKISCSDQRCIEGIQSSDAVCSVQNNLCSYNFQYGDGSATSGYYISDTLHLETILGTSRGSSTAPVVFGCSTKVSGQLTSTDRAVDGIFGFGQSSLSVISQLSDQGITPKVFSHCLRGDSSGGGILVLGEIVDPSIVYSPLVTGQPHYNLNLQNISVNGNTLSIDPSVFTTATNGGTIIDSGTTLAYLADGAYTPVINAIDSAARSKSAQRVPVSSQTCYIITSSPSDVFPQVSFNFEGATMTLGPQDYLLEEQTTTGITVWCIGFGSIKGGMTILGDLVLKDKIIVYDLAGQRIGWTNYDCSMSVNVSTTANTGTTETVSTGDSSDNSSPSPRIMPNKLTLLTVILSLVYWSIIGTFMSR